MKKSTGNRHERRTGLEPHGLAKLDAVVLGQDLGRHAAEGAEHRPAGVDELELTVALERLRVRREARGVPAVVAGELACAGDENSSTLCGLVGSWRSGGRRLGWQC